MPDVEDTIAQRSVDESGAPGPRYQPLVIVLAAVCAGIAADRFRPLPVFAWWGIAAGAWPLWLGAWRCGRQRPAAVLLLLSVAGSAAAWHHCRWHLFGSDELGCFARADAQPVCLEAVALGSARSLPSGDFDPMRSLPQGDRCRLELKLLGLRDGANWRKVSGRTRLEVGGLLPEVEAGDRLWIFGQLRAASPPQNPGEFDYAAYLRSRRQRSRLHSSFAQCVSVVGPDNGWGLRQLIGRARSHGNRTLQRYLDPRQAALASAVLLGMREHIDPEQKQAFLETGTIHLLAISGLHVGILAGALMFLMLRAPIPHGWAMFLVAAAMFFYMLLTDARPPVVRATILVLVMCAAAYLGRRALGFNTLAAAALVVLAVNPADLFHAGAQLSFLAVAELVWFAPRWFASTLDRDPLERLIEQSLSWPERWAWAVWRSVRHLTLVSTMIWLLVLPLVMARFHVFSPVALILNTLLWFPMAAALITGFGTLLFGGLFPGLGMIFGGLCNANLWLLDTAVASAAEIPLSHFWVPGPADWWLAGFYGSLGVLAAVPRLRPPRRWCAALLAGWISIGFAPALLRHDPQRLDCTFLSMGHGCAVVLELPSGQTLLYDAGRFGSPGGAAQSIAGFLWSRGITHLDAVVLSHGDVDHYNALPGLLERFSVGTIYVSPFMFEQRNAALDALQAAVAGSGVPMRRLVGGDVLPGGRNCRIEVLHPPRRGMLGPDNANSIVLAAEHLGHRILLPGDLESPGLEAVLAEEPLDCDVLLAPHHGSRRSNPPGLAQWCTPERVVVSGSRRWDLEPVRQTYAAVGAEVLPTTDNGAVRITVSPAGVRMERFLRP